MFDAVSPYALLCLSRPKQTPTVVTPYDLYSQAAFQSCPPAEESAPIPAAQVCNSAAPIFAPPAPVRTHYISDIHTKHGAAGKRAVFTREPLR